MNRIILILFSIFSLLSCSTTDRYRYNSDYYEDYQKKKISYPLAKIKVKPSNALLKLRASMILTANGIDTKGNYKYVSPYWKVKNPEVGTVKPIKGKSVVFTSKTRGVAFITVYSGKISSTVVIEVK